MADFGFRLKVMIKNLLKRIWEFIAKMLERRATQPEEKSIEILPELTVPKLYVNCEIGLRIRSAPEIKADNILEVLSCGQEVTKIGEQDKWFKVQYNSGKEGWVSSVYLTENKPVDSSQVVPKEDVQDAFPKFKIGVANLANDDNTIKLRKIINDEFGGSRNGWNLQCTEYAQFKVQQMGITIKWPADRPRHGGLWAGIFEKHGLYKVFDIPKAGCAMCFTTGFRTPEMNATGHVAFVEQVFDDESIKITEANWPPPGKYNERRVPKAEWQDKYKCRFVGFS